MIEIPPENDPDERTDEAAKRAQALPGHEERPRALEDIVPVIKELVEYVGEHEAGHQHPRDEGVQLDEVVAERARAPCGHGRAHQHARSDEDSEGVQGHGPEVQVRDVDVRDHEGRTDPYPIPAACARSSYGSRCGPRTSMASGSPSRRAIRATTAQPLQARASTMSPSESSLATPGVRVHRAAGSAPSRAPLRTSATEDAAAPVGRLRRNPARASAWPPPSVRTGPRPR